MEKLNNSAIRRQIDEVIMESYLRCLSDREMREYFGRFLDSCDCVIREKAGGSADIRLTGIKVALLRGYLLLNGGERPAPRHALMLSPRTSGRDISRERFLEQIVAARSAILRLLEEYNPRICRNVLRRMTGGRDRRVFHNTRRRMIVSISCGVVLLTAIFTTWIVLFR